MQSSKRPGIDPWVVYGAGGHGAAVTEVLAASGAVIHSFVDAGRVSEGSRLGIPIQAELPVGHIKLGYPVAVAIGDNSQRESLVSRLYGDGASAKNFPPIAHPSASVSGFATVMEGAVILQGACVGPAASLGRFCVVATGAVVAHDGRMADFSFMSANTVLSASLLGERSFLGLGSVVAQGSSIGSDVVVGAQSFVDGSIPNRVVAHGVPARPTRTRSLGEPYLGSRSGQGESGR